MSQQFSIIPVLYLLGAAHGAFLAIALFIHHRGSKRANIYLGLYTLVFVAALIDYFIDLSGLAPSLVQLRAFLWPKEFLYGVLLYFYTRELTTPGKYRLRGRQYWHLAPVFAHISVTWTLLLLPKADQYTILYEEPTENPLYQLWIILLDDVELGLSVIQLTIYLLLCLRLLRQHRERLLQTYSFREKVSLDWLTYLIWGTLVVYFIWLAEQLLELGDRLDQALDFGLGISMVVLIYSMSILGLRQAQIFSASRSQGESSDGKEPATLPKIDTIEEIDRESKQKYRNSALSAELSAELMGTVDQAMEQDQWYRDSSLSLPQLAEKLELPVNYLSQAINQQKGQNFFDYINGFRVQEVTRLMQESPSSNVLDLALSAGFNSKSPFYAAFRKHTGVTPSQYRKNLSSSDDSSQIAS
ncbi:MAG: AraC family transcriptional regulator [Pseudomonadales bacterium]|nr:AraC family transcriptional regulator [Pseudomonadales bacterium]